VSAVSAEAIAEAETTPPPTTKTINVNNRNRKVALNDIKCVSIKLFRVNVL
jgi:hypothetical protein